ncbi:MAG: hypothetical protein V9G24_20315 [Rhodoblastus sp.]
MSSRLRVLLAQQLAELVPLGLLHLAAEIGGGHAMCLVADDQVVFRRGFQLRAQLA